MMSSYVFVSSIIIIGLFALTINGEDLQTRYENDLQKFYHSQVQKEFFASNIYLTFAHQLAKDGIYQGFAEFFFDSAKEERDHGKKLLDFSNVRNNIITFQDIQINQTYIDMNDLDKMIYAANRLEKEVYDNLIDVREKANQARDYPTVHFIEKEMLVEQTTALKYMNDLVQRLKRNTEHSNILLQMMDQDLRKKELNKP